MSQNRTLLLGLDFGSTTCSALIMGVAMASDGKAGATKLTAPQILYRATPVFTPFLGNKIDEERVLALIKQWLNESGITVTDLFSASAIITGLAAQQVNVASIRHLISKQIPKAAIVAAEDPHLESWLAFMGSSAALSRYHAETAILNLDIGGGTTNGAIGVNGNVLATSSHYIGARHFQFKPGSYQLITLSPYGLILLKDFAINKTIGDTLNDYECERIIKFYVHALEAIALNNREFFDTPLAKKHVQAASDISHRASKITFSGGVGELVYEIAKSGKSPNTTLYGDFGIDLAKAILGSPLLSADLKTHKPENHGRATVFGLTLNSTEISGSSIYLPHPEILPLNDIPILAKLAFSSPAKDWQDALALASAHRGGVCFQIMHVATQLQQIRDFAQMLAKLILASSLKNPLVLLIKGNIGKTLGNYITNWGKMSIQLVVIDELNTRDAHFVNLGKMQQGVIPVSFYGMY
ncbi:MAG: ethanolamine ammonia-lyase reactivating factor EutA [Methylophilaceae bacterium]